MAVMMILNQDVPEIQRLSKDERGILFAFLDKDGSSSINLNEFLDFGQILLLQLTKVSDYATFVEEKFPHVHQSKWFQSLCKTVRSTCFEYFIDFILLLNAVIIAVQDYPLLAGNDVTDDPHYDDGYIDTIWELMETIFTFLYLVEAILKITVEGWKKYSESMRNMFDFFITLLAVLATAYVYCTLCLTGNMNTVEFPRHLTNTCSVQFLIRPKCLQQQSPDPVCCNGESPSTRTLTCYFENISNLRDDFCRHYTGS
jgi:two pore calcium channel protein